MLRQHQAPGFLQAQLFLELQDFNWSAEYAGSIALRDEIANHRAVELEVTREKFYLTTEKRMELFGSELARMKKELARQDYKDVPTPVLVKLVLETYETLRAEDVEPATKTPEEIEQDRHAELLLMRLTTGTPAPRDSGKLVNQKEPPVSIGDLAPK